MSDGLWCRVSTSGFAGKADRGIKLGKALLLGLAARLFALAFLYFYETE